MSDLSKGYDALEWLNTELAEWKQDFDAVEKFSCDIKSNEGHQKLMGVDEQRTAEPKSGIPGRRGSNQAKGGHAKDKKKQDNGIERSGNIAPDQITTTTVLDNLNSQTAAEGCDPLGGARGATRGSELRNSKELGK